MRTVRATVTRGTVSGVCDQLAGKSEKITRKNSAVREEMLQWICKRVGY